jgi:hypothetical protein
MKQICWRINLESFNFFKFFWKYFFPAFIVSWWINFGQTLFRRKKNFFSVCRRNILTEVKVFCSKQGKRGRTCDNFNGHVRWCTQSKNINKRKMQFTFFDDWVTRDRCYDLKNIFDKKISEKIGVFYSKQR